MASLAHQRVARLLHHLAPASATSRSTMPLASSPTAAVATLEKSATAAANPTSAVATSSPSASASLATATPSKPRTCVKCETRGRVAILTLSRPRALNALNDELMREVGECLLELEAAGNIGCIVLTGEGRAFAAGADIKQMASQSYYGMSFRDMIEPWTIVSKCKIPLIAAVNGVALGGGCEIAMMCDVILASETAKFGQPEVKIGTIPGAGGTQRLVRAVGKSRAMEMILTGEAVPARELVEAGLVSRVYSAEELMPAALKMATQIASLSLPLVKLAKQAVLASYDSTLTTGMFIERGLFQSTFALKDQKEGMQAFIQKRKPEWTHQ